MWGQQIFEDKCIAAGFHSSHKLQKVVMDVYSEVSGAPLLESIS